MSSSARHTTDDNNLRYNNSNVSNKRHRKSKKVSSKKSQQHSSTSHSQRAFSTSSSSDSDHSEHDTKSGDKHGYPDSDSDASSDFMELIESAKTKKIKTDSCADNVSVYSKTTLPPSPVPSTSSSSSSSSSGSASPQSSAEGRRGRSPSPGVPEGEWEIEEIRDYIKDDFGGLYLVKWKGWPEESNTWEPSSNLLNCEDELLRFYSQRRRQRKEALARSKFENVNGNKRRKGPALPDIPPDPRTFDDKATDCLESAADEVAVERLIKKAFQKVMTKRNTKPRWPMSKIHKTLDEWCDGSLTGSELTILREELIILEVEKSSKEYRSEMKDWEDEMNRATGGFPQITVENEVEITPLPRDFNFVNSYVPGEGVEIPNAPPVGCQCGTRETSCYDARSQCCAFQFGQKFAYTKYRKINLQQGSPIYECNSMCQCGPDCTNRVVQDGKSDHKFCIFRTKNDCGWGVKTLKSIKKGTFVTLYVGEVVKSEEAERREKLREKDGKSCTYMFDLDFNDSENYPYTVDASKYGNVSHFINHSCNPNLAVYAVWVDCLDPNLPKLAMFALRDIARNEELTFDYDLQINSTSRSQQENDNEAARKPERKRTKCKCGSTNCRRYIL